MPKGEQMDKTIDLSRSVRDLCSEFPELVDIMKEMGFESIANPALLNTAGRFMTIPKGAAMMGINLKKIKDEIASRGYIIKE